MKRIGMSILSLALLLCLAACGNTNPAASGPPPRRRLCRRPPAPQEDYDGKLVLDGPMELEYARNFAVDRYKGGYRHVHCRHHREHLSGGARGHERPRGTGGGRGGSAATHRPGLSGQHRHDFAGWPPWAGWTT